LFPAGGNISAGRAVDAGRLVDAGRDVYAGYTQAHMPPHLEAMTSFDSYRVVSTTCCLALEE